MIRLSGNKSRVYYGFVLFLGVLGAVFYPILISPFLDPEKYRRIQSESRKNIKREDIQPGNMNVWKNPFAKNSEKAESVK